MQILRKKENKMNSLLKIENLHVSAEDKEILKGIDLNINKGEIHVIMGPNGSREINNSKCNFKQSRIY